MRTPGWLSEYVEKICDFLVGTVVLRGMSTVITPPAVSRPMDRGVTSSRSRSERGTGMGQEGVCLRTKQRCCAPLWSHSPSARTQGGGSRFIVRSKSSHRQ
eukprot:195789-Pyramimonas_sp.AAC.1